MLLNDISENEKSCKSNVYRILLLIGVIKVEMERLALLVPSDFRSANKICNCLAAINIFSQNEGQFIHVGIGFAGP